MDGCVSWMGGLVEWLGVGNLSIFGRRHNQSREAMVASSTGTGDRHGVGIKLLVDSLQGDIVGLLSGGDSSEGTMGETVDRTGSGGHGVG